MYKEIYILTGYKSHSTSNSIFNDFLLKCNIQLLSKSDFILIGDFNHNTYDENSSFEKYMNQINLSRGLPIEISTTDFNTQIDVIFLSKSIRMYNSGVYETFFSDHKPIFIGIKSLINLSHLKT